MTQQARLFQLVRDHAQSAKSGVIRYQTLPDEKNNLRLASLRVYGRASEWLVVQAAAGLDSPENALTERVLVLPTETVLADFKERAGYGDE